MATSIEQQRLLNSKAPISRLNDDILSQIFMLNADFDFDHPHIPSRTIRRTSQVFQSWRDLILNYPLIWATSLDFADPMAWMQLVLYRAGNAPLSVIYPSISHRALVDKETLSEWRYFQLERPMILLHSKWAGPTDNSKFELALFLFSRSRRFMLMLKDEHQSYHPAGQSTFSVAPYLQELSLRMNFSLWPRRNGESPSGPNIFDGGVPYSPFLKSISVSGCRFKSFDFESSTFLNLTELIAKNLRGDKVLKEEEWLGVLARLPELELLELDNCFATDLYFHDEERAASLRASAETTAKPTPVLLSKLQFIKLNGLYIPTSKVFSQIKFPPSCAMDIKYWRVDDRHHYFSSMVSDIRNRVQAAIAFRKVIDLSFHLNHYPNRGWDDLRFLNNRHTADEKILNVSWIPESGFDSMTFLPSFTSIVEIISPHVISLYLDMSGFDEGESAHQLNLLRVFDKLKVLCIPNDVTLDFIIELLSDGHASPSPILPGLRLIMLGGLYTTAKTSRNVTRLYKRRTELGAPISDFTIRNCQGPGVRKLTRNLKGLGIQVEWDGVPKEEEDGGDEDNEEEEEDNEGEEEHE